MRRMTPSVDVLANASKKDKEEKEIPYSSELAQAADQLVDEVVQAVNSEKMGTIEAAGQLSMATLLKGTAEGSIPLFKAFSMLNSLAQRKTPDPIQRIDARHEVDMRAIFVQAIADNPGALDRAREISLAAREQVKQTIGAVDNSLELKSTSDPDLPNKSPFGSNDSPDKLGLESFSLPKTDWTPGESPVEIQELDNKE